MESKSKLQLKHFGTTDKREIIALMNQSMRDSHDNRPKDLNDWVSMQVPYFVPEDQLPCPLPSMADIEAARDTKNDLTREKAVKQYYVYRVSGVYAVKFGHSPLILQEAENILFLAENTKIRVPKVYAAFEHQGADPQGLLKFDQNSRCDLPKYYYLVMEFLPGRVCTDNVWYGLSTPTKFNIVRKAAEQIRLLRNVPTPSPAYYGRIHHQGWFPGIYLLAHTGPPGSMKGPYDSHEAFLKAVHTTSEIHLSAQFTDDFSPPTKYYLQTFWEVMSRAVGTTPILCHLDFNNEQIMLQETDDKENPDVVIMDWAYMGWVPAYMATARSWSSWPDPVCDALYNWEIGKDLKPVHLDTALYFREFWR